MKFLVRFLLVAASVVFFSLSEFCNAAEEIKTDDFVRIFSELMQVKPSSESTFLRGVGEQEDLYGIYSAINHAVPNTRFDGKQWWIDRLLSVSTAQAVKSFVIWQKTPLYMEAEAPEFLSQVGFDWVSKGYKPTDTVYLATALCNMGTDPGFGNNRFLNLEEARQLIIKLRDSWRNQQACFPQIIEFSNIPGIPRSQQYFLDGPIYNQLDAVVEVPKSSAFHQYASFYGSATATNTLVNTIGIWGAGISHVNGGRVWGGFLTAESPSGSDKDSQLVGLEVDVINRGKPGVIPNQSKIGIQLVSIGENNSSAALEVISDHRSRWENALLIDENSISETGAIIGISQHNPIRVGLDFQNAVFKDAAAALSPNSKIVFRQQGTSDAAIYRDNINNGHLVINAGPAGFRITNNRNSVNLLNFSDEGWIRSDSRVWRNYAPWIIGVLVGVTISLFMNIILLMLFFKLRKTSHIMD